MKIKILKNGPYLVTGATSLSRKNIAIDKNGDTIKFEDVKEYNLEEIGENYTLCRCGKSKNKPFCDGTHGKIKGGFNGEETASVDLASNKARIFETNSLKLIDVVELCDHSRFCRRASGIRNLMELADNTNIDSVDESDTYDIKAISENLENITPKIAKKIAIEESKLCPSGRLRLFDKKTEECYDDIDFEPSIAIVYDKQKECDGPIWVRGKIPIESSEGKQYEIRNKVTLCQCGKSENKPFCDGNHWLDKETKNKFKKKWNLD
ncbi:MAG: CDGSH iron-sulfur domain-containing protein [Methanobacteriaceae archaeon]